MIARKRITLLENELTARKLIKLSENGVGYQKMGQFVRHLALASEKAVIDAVLPSALWLRFTLKKLPG
ncbi:hypothetical protein [Methanosarcina sp.]|uniref:hypothetical protein n=1 Tax=Methanosarcina sp. TaxID=2213 RepID=UPI003BB7E768